MENLKTNPFNHLTAKERETLSFPAKLLLNKKLLTNDVLDFGCGFGKDVELLKERGINIVGYDKHYFPKYPIKEFDTIICSYVLNVLMQEEQTSVLMEVSQLLKPTGKAFFSVRRDLQYEGFRTHRVHQKPTYQCNVKLAYKSIFKNENCEVYEYRHYNQLSRKENISCPFCNPDSHAAKDCPIRVPQVAVLRDLCSSATRRHRSASTPTCGTRIRHSHAACE